MKVHSKLRDKARRHMKESLADFFEPKKDPSKDGGKRSNETREFNQASGDKLDLNPDYLKNMLRNASLVA